MGTNIFVRAPMLFISKIKIGSLVNRYVHTTFLKEHALATDQFERFSQDIRLCDWQLPLTIVLTLFGECRAGLRQSSRNF